MPSLWTRFAAAAKAFRLGSTLVDPSWAGFGKTQNDYAPEEYGTYSATSVGVYACTNLRSTALSALPLKVYRGTGDSRKEVTNGPLADLLKRVNPFWTMAQLLEMTEQSLGLWGQAFWILERGDTGRRPPTEIWWARPDRVKVIPHQENYIAGYIVEVNGRKIPFTPDEVIWFRLPNPMDEFAGLSPIAAARLSIELGRDGLQANRQLFRQGMQGVNVISPANPDITWDKAKVELLSQLLERRAKGKDNAHRSLVMGHQLNSQPLGISPADAQFIEQMRWSLADICRVYNVPPVLVQDLEKATYSNFEQALQAFWTLTMVPQSNRIATTITEQLLPMFPGQADEAAFDLTGVSALQEKEDAKWTREAGQLQSGVITINEWRKGRGLKPVMWGDAWWAPSTATPVENADVPEPPAAPPPPTNDTTPADMADKALRLVAEIKAWEFGGEQHSGAMKAFDDRATGHEKRWAKMTRDLFEQQEAEILASLGDEGKSIITKRRGSTNPFDQAEWEKRFADEAVDQLRVIVKDAGGAVYGDLGIGGTFNLRAPSVTKFIRQRAQRFAESVNKTTWDRLKFSLAEGEKAGETIDQLKERVKVVMRGRIKSDAETIARTEVIGGLNGGALEAARQSGVVKAKKWLAAIDNRTRDTHIETHGEEVPLDADFSLGGPAPGQIGDPAEDINCRCTMTFVVDDGKLFRPGIIDGLRAFVANGHHHWRQVTRAPSGAFLHGRNAVNRQFTTASLVRKADGQDGKKVFTFRATSEAVDRHGEIVTADGWEFRNWEANPVILDSHDYWGGIEAIVGRGVALNYDATAKSWDVDVVFSESPKGRLAEQLVEEGSLRAVSVGFQSKERVMGQGNEPMKHTVKELLEISLVAIPANPEAVRVRGLASLAGMAQTIADEAKAGRTLSAKNENLIRSASEALTTVLSSLGEPEGEGKSAGGDAADIDAEPVLAVDMDALKAFAGQKEEK